MCQYVGLQKLKKKKKKLKITEKERVSNIL